MNKKKLNNAKCCECGMEFNTTDNSKEMVCINCLTKEKTNWMEKKDE